MSLLKKYVPLKPKDVVGQEKGVSAIRSFISSYSPGAKYKALLIHGQTGTGKTSSVHAVASEFNLEVVEINGSDTRNAKAIEERVGSALGQKSLFFSGKLILIDDVDGLSGTKDRGGIKAVLKLMETSRFPIILTAIDGDSSKLKALRKKCEQVVFNELDYGSLVSLLTRICDTENISYTDNALKTIAYRSAGDARSAINDLDATIKDGCIDEELLNMLGDRDRKESLVNALMKIFKSTNFDVALTAFDMVSENVDERMLWLDYNVAKEYTKAGDVSRAYDALSKADVFNGRTRRRQYYRFWVYLSLLQSVGVALAKDEKYSGRGTYKQTSRLFKMWMANQKKVKGKAIAEKMREGDVHESKTQIMKEFLVFIKEMSKDKIFLDSFTKEFDLDKTEVAWLVR